MNSSKQELQQLGLKVYLRPEVIRMIFLGFSAGLPHPLLFASLSAWLASVKISMTDLTMFAWVGIIYAIKFLWAPLLDNVSIKYLSQVMGQRRSWIIVTQTMIFVGLLFIPNIDPQTELGLLAIISVGIAIASASQDIAIDAYRVEIISNKYQGAMGASYQLGYRISYLFSAAGALYLADYYSWKIAYQALAPLMIVGIITVLLIPEPFKKKSLDKEGYSFRKSIVGPFMEFFRRNGSWSLMLIIFIGVYRMSDLLVNVVANPFYIDIGFDLSEIATITKVFGFAVTVLGTFIGGLSVVRYGIPKPLIISSILLAFTNLFFLLLESMGPNIEILILTISADNFALGFSGSIFIAFLSSLTNRYYAASQYALFTSIMFFLGITLSGFSGQLVDNYGWSNFFLLAAFMGIPSILFSFIIVRKGWQEQN